MWRGGFAARQRTIACTGAAIRSRKNGCVIRRGPVTMVGEMMKRPWLPRGVAEPGYFSLVHRRDSRYASCRLAFAAAKWRKTCRKSLSRGLRFASLAPVRDFGITSESFPTKAYYPGKFSAFRALCRTPVLFLRIMSESFPLKQTLFAKACLH
jgi:hypothetical protein